MKSILMSIRPEWVAKILNGEKTIEIRKKFPKDYVGWVYIYCTKTRKNYNEHHNWFIKANGGCWGGNMYDGKVVARFWCDKVEGIWKTTNDVWVYGYDYVVFPNSLEKDSCLTEKQLDDYFKPKQIGANHTYGYAIHISKLEVFEKPSELKEFNKPTFNFCKLRCDNNFEKSFCKDVCSHNLDEERLNVCCEYSQYVRYWYNKPNYLTKAPQNYCYIESEK